MHEKVTCLDSACFAEDKEALIASGLPTHESKPESYRTKSSVRYQCATALLQLSQSLTD